MGIGVSLARPGQVASVADVVFGRVPFTFDGNAIASPRTIIVSNGWFGDI